MVCTVQWRIQASFRGHNRAQTYWSNIAIASWVQAECKLSVHPTPCSLVLPCLDRPRTDLNCPTGDLFARQTDAVGSREDPAELTRALGSGAEQPLQRTASAQSLESAIRDQLLTVSSSSSGIFGYVNYLVEKDRKFIVDTLINGMWTSPVSPQSASCGRCVALVGWAGM